MNRRYAPLAFFGSLLAAAALVALAAWILLAGDDCFQMVVDSQFAGDADRFGRRFDAASGCASGDLTGSLAKNFAFVVVYSLTLAALLRYWWNRSWDSEPGKSQIPGSAFGLVALAAIVASAVGNLMTGWALDINESSATLARADLISAIAWAKWLMVAVLAVATVGVTISQCVVLATTALRFFRDRHEELDYIPVAETWTPEDKPGFKSFSIALSGGGIRSAAFSLGAMSALEDFDMRLGPEDDADSLLNCASLLSTVSGGGYAGSAWRIAAGPDADRSSRSIIGNPNHLVPKQMPLGAVESSESGDAGAGQPPLFERLRERRSFLRNGRGGLPLSFLRALLQLVFHLGLLLWAVGIVAWLVGRFVGSWAITSPEMGIEYGRLVGPAQYAAYGFLIFAGLRLFTLESKWRKAWDGLAAFWGLVSAGLLAGLVVVPWMVEELLPAIEELIPGGTGAQSSVAVALTGGIAASAWRVLQAPLKTRAPYLGGVLLALALVLFGLVVASESADPPSKLFLFPDQWSTWGLLVGAYVVLLSTLNPDMWSLHPIYTRLLRGTFANRLLDGRWTDLENDWPRLSSYHEASGPRPLICAAAARYDRSNTGIPVVSMTFEPDFVTLHKGPSVDGEQSSVAIPTEQYEEIMSGRFGAKRLESIVGAVAISAAAVAPSLGKLSMGSTDALIAALNLRLGVWMPNPDYLPGERRIGPHMINMFKEMRGRFDLEEPNLYVTDGGHWENLGLVELIRRKASVIIAVDSSLNEPYSFKAFVEAVELAELECGARITIEDGNGLEEMRPGNSPRPPKNWCLATIDYPSDSEGSEAFQGRMLYIKAQASDAMPLDILRYAKEDPSFPNYSTANQLLTDKEFCHLAVLGRESTIRGVDEHFDWLFAEYEYPVAPAQTPAPTADTPESWRPRLARKPALRGSQTGEGT